MRFGIALLLTLVLLGCGDNEIVTNVPPGGGGPASGPAPLISGNPPSIVKVGDTYAFTPTVLNIPTDRQVFTINKTSLFGATFDTSTGKILGTPGADHVGTYENIVVSVYDRTNPDRKAALSPFTIRVGQAWAPGGDLPSFVSRAAGVEAAGQAHLIGGRVDAGESGDIYRYDSRAGWVRVAALERGRSSHAAIAVENKVYVIGGLRTINVGAPEYLASVEQYDPSTNVLTGRGTLTAPRSGHSACLLDGKIYVAGGFNRNGLLGSTEIYDPASDQWVPGPSLNHVRENHQCFVLNGRIHVVGGYGTGGVPMEIFDPQHPEEGWVVQESAAPRLEGAAVHVANGRAYLIGGFQDSPRAYLDRVHAFDPAVGDWVSTGETILGGPRAIAAGVQVGGTLWLLGGETSVDPQTKRVHIYDPVFDY